MHNQNPRLENWQVWCILNIFYLNVFSLLTLLSILPIHMIVILILQMVGLKQSVIKSEKAFCRAAGGGMAGIPFSDGTSLILLSRRI